MNRDEFTTLLSEHLWLADSNRFTAHHPTRDQYVERIRKFCEIYRVISVAVYDFDCIVDHSSVKPGECCSNCGWFKAGDMSMIPPPAPAPEAIFYHATAPSNPSKPCDRCDYPLSCSCTCITCRRAKEERVKHAR